MAARFGSPLGDDVLGVAMIMGAMIIVYTAGTICWIANGGAERDDIGQVILIQILGFITVLVHVSLTVLHRERHARRRRRLVRER